MGGEPLRTCLRLLRAGGGAHADNGLEAVFAGSPWVLDAELALVPEPTAAASR